MKLSTLFAVILFSLIGFINFNCSENYNPKPIGYPRADFPEKLYMPSGSRLPYLFDIPQYPHIQADKSPNAEPYWINVQYPALNATLHVSYKKINNNLPEYTEDSRKMVYKHTGKADNIIPKEWINTEENVYGILYEIKGDAASTLQFHLTDSMQHFVRASFYFNTVPNKDSLAPAQAFIREDIDRMIESFHWNPEFSDK